MKAFRKPPGSGALYVLGGPAERNRRTPYGSTTWYSEYLDEANRPSTSPLVVRVNIAAQSAAAALPRR